MIALLSEAAAKQKVVARAEWAGMPQKKSESA
jgi:hypothetical protein